MAILLTFGLSACNQDSGEEEETEVTTTATTTATSATTKPPVTPLELMVKGELKASVVYQTEATSSVLEAVDMIKAAFAENYDAEISSVIDSLHTADDSKIEILIGKTKYDESANALEALDEYSYSVSVVGNKIIVAANHDYLFPIAVEHLLECLYSADSTVSIEKEYKHESDAFDSALLCDKLGDTEYTIVYKSGSSEARSVAEKLQKAFTELYITVEIKPDSEPTEGKEILIGQTNRDLSFESKAYYMSSWLELDESGNMAITGNLDHGADVLIEYMNNLGADGGEVVIIEPMLGLSNPDGMGYAPLYEGSGEIEVIKGFDPSNSYYITVHGASRSDYEEYTSLLEDEGFTRYRSSKANNNLFETWTDGYSILTMAHIAYTDPATTDRATASASLGPVKYISIAVDCIENSALPTNETEIADITTEQMTSVGTAYGYVLRLSDGRFIIFDGGVSSAAPKIYEIVKAQNVLDGKPVIAAWYISHFHSDHIGAANEFMKNYSEEIEIESFVYNLPGDEVYIDKNTAEGANNVEDTNMRARGVTMYERFAEFYPDVQVFIAHAGQQFRYGDIYIDVLWTSENLYRKQMLDTNMSSVLISVTGESGRMILLGDQQEYGCAMMDAIYGSTLKCDLVHVAHHGYNGGDEAMYASMAAKYAMWSSSVEKINNNNLHYNPSYGRNKFDYTTVDANIAPTNSGEPIILFEGMTREQILALDIGLTH